MRELGADCVSVETPCLDAASRTTFANPARVLAILRPRCREDVQIAVRIASQFGVALYPFSSGRNWGYGSRAPVEDGVLLDLGAMNRILDFDEALGYVTVEPGVTQRQLSDFLRQRGSRLWMDATGASVECSVVGNTLERGFGHTPLGDHAANVCGLEVVLPTGECVETGFSRFESSKVGSLSRWGLGPSLDGLFAQSNLGVVTRMSVWLMPAPEHFEAFFFMCPDDESLAAVVDALRPLRMDGTLRSTIHIGNDYKVATATTRFPFDSAGQRGFVDRDAMRALRQRLQVGAWNGSGALYGSKGQVKEARRRVKRALAGKVSRLQFVNDRLIGLMRRFSGPFRVLTGWDITRTLSLLEPVYNLMKGVPTDTMLASTYWRKRDLPQGSLDPDRDGCGLLWCSPVLPSVGRDVRAVADMAATVVLAHGFEPQMSLSLATERSAVCVTTITYDRTVPGEDERARRCYDELMSRLLEAGYPPYRVNLRSMHIASTPGAYDDLLGRIKHAVDPAGILAPGRYVPAAPGVRAERHDVHGGVPTLLP